MPFDHLPPIPSPQPPAPSAFGNHKSDLFSTNLVFLFGLVLVVGFFFFLIPHISEIIQHLSVCVWLISFSIMSSSFIHAVANEFWGWRMVMVAQ